MTLSPVTGKSEAMNNARHMLCSA